MAKLEATGTKVYVGYGARHKGNDETGEVLLFAPTLDELEAAWNRYQSTGIAFDREMAGRVLVLKAELLEGAE